MSWSQNGTPTSGPSPSADTFSGNPFAGDLADGEGGNDLLAGEGGNDTLEGGVGYDAIYGGADNDLLTDTADGGNLNGDDGNDTIAVTLEGTLDSYGAFAYGGAGDDLISVSGAGLEDSLGAFVGISALGDGGNDTIVTGASDDFIGGGDDDDSIDSGDGNDDAYGDAGNDTILGGAGDDVLYGEASINDTLTGNDSLDGGNGDDSIYGEGGDDTIRGGDGVDYLSGGDGTNALDFSDATNGVAMVLAQGEIFDDGFGKQEVIDGASFTVAYGSNFSDPLFAGSAGDDFLFGRGGNDEVFGNLGDDTIEGGEGNDRMVGEEGTDLVRGDAGDDTVYAGRIPDDDHPIFGQVDDTADTLDGGDDTDVLVVNRGDATTAITAVAGTSIAFDGLVAENFEVVAIRTGSGDDSLVGGDGNDTLDGGTGADTLEGGDGLDLLVIDRGTSTDNLVFTGGPVVEFDGTGATGFEDFAVRTGAGADSLTGGDGNDSLDGGIGTDTFDGGAGDDIIDGGDPLDTLIGGEAPPIVNETDLVTYENAGEAISFSLTEGTGPVFAGSYGVDDLRNIEQVVGTAFDDSMEMQWGDETVDILMSGGDGNDAISLVGDAAAKLDGGEGNDTISGGNANDTILGGEGDDFILGGEGDDSIVATPGNDTVEAGPGDDVIDTGDENDLVIWNIGDGNDVIAMGNGTDTLQLEGWTGDDSDNWTSVGGGAGAIFTYNDGVGPAFTLTTSGVEAVTCFATGTRILTARGEVPVETLRAGDLVVAPGTGAPLKPVRWVGHTRVDATRHRAPHRIAPVLVRAGALGHGVPARDLRVSPEHAFLLQGRLVPARLLVNGGSIVQETWHRTLTYWHVELDAHGVLVAEGALAESYFDDGNRHLFDNRIIAIDPDFAAGRQGGRYAAEACAPPVLTTDDPALPGVLAALPATPARARRA